MLLKKIITPIFIGILITFAVSSMFTKPKLVLADTLLSFNEGYGSTVGDSSGSVSGTITGATWRTYDLCFDDKCLYFDGSDWINFGDESSFDFTASTDFTIQFWFRHGPASATEVIMQKYESTGGDGGFRIQMESDGDISFGVDDANGGFADDNITSTAATYDDNQWHFVTAVKDGTTGIYLYIDGILVASDTSIGSTGTLANDDTFYIGDSNGGDGGDEYIGFLDEVKIYTTAARTQEEINADKLGANPDRGTSASFGPDNSYLSNGLVAYWSMNETAADSCGSGYDTCDTSGNGIHLAWANNTTTTTGKYGNGTTYDGTNDYGSCTDATCGGIGKLDFTAGASFSWGGWFKSTDDIGMLGGKRNSNSASDRGYALQFNDNISVTGNPACWVSDGTNNTTVWSQIDISDDTWHHAFCVVDGTTVSVYVDGNFVDSNTNSAMTGSYDNAVDFKIGELPNGNQDYLGQIDEFRVYNRALSPSDIANLYKWGPGPLIHYKFDENTGTSTVNDSSGNGYSGTMNGSMTDSGWIQGKFGSAIDLDGSNDSISVNYDAGAILYVSLWVKPKRTQNYDTVVTWHNSYAGSLMFWNNEWNLYSAGVIDLYGSSVSTNDWYHIAFGYEAGNAAYLYVNGQLVDSDLSIGTPSTSTDFVIGDSFDGNAFYGSIDDVRIYNYVRTPAQIIEDMNAGHPAPGSPVGSAVAHWGFDEGALNTCSGGTNDFCDSSVNANDLAFSGTSGGFTNSGKFDKAFNGTNAVWASRADDADFDVGITDDYSISLWYKGDNATNPSTTEYLFNKAGATTAGYAIYANSSDQICFGIDDDTSWGPDIASCTTDDQYGTTWKHLVAVRDYTDTDKIYIYIDGVLKDSDIDTTTATLANSLSLYLADRDGTDNGDEFTGDLDEVQVFRSALTADQVKQLFNGGYMSVMGALSTDSSGNPSWSANDEYCPPGQGTSCIPPVGHWKLDEKSGTTVYDSSGNGYNGTISNSKWVKGKLGSGIFTKEDNVADSMTVSDPASGDFDFGANDDFTLEMWAKIQDTKNPVSFMLSKGYDFNPANAGYTIDAGIAGGSPGSSGCGISDGIGGTSDDTTAFVGVDGLWHHFVCVLDRDGSEMGTAGLYFFLDGVLQSSNASLAEGSLANSADLVIGELNTTYEYNDSTFDDIRIYNYARTPAQIAWDYNQGKPVVYLEFDENTGIAPTTLYDSSGNALNGTASGSMTSADWVSGKFNTALDFDGSDDVVTLTNTTQIDMNNGLSQGFTFSSWIYPHTVGETAGRIFQKSSDGGTTDSSSTYCRVSGSSPFDIVCNVDLSTDPGTFTVSAAAPANTWTHVAFSWANDADDEVTIWINGVPNTSSASYSGDPTAESNNLYIGGNGTTTNNTRAFDGLIDDFRVYNYELTPNQITNIVNGGAALYFGP